MTDELKPCPFCGKEVSMTYNGLENAYFVYHRGEPCGLYEPIAIDGEMCKSYDEAKDAWNRRTSDDG